MVPPLVVGFLTSEVPFLTKNGAYMVPSALTRTIKQLFSLNSTFLNLQHKHMKIKENKALINFVKLVKSRL
jgi:hypothetical protein